MKTTENISKSTDSLKFEKESKENEDIVTKLGKASNAIYLLTDPLVAEAVSNLMKEAIEVIEKSRLGEE